MGNKIFIIDMCLDKCNFIIIIDNCIYKKISININRNLTDVFIDILKDIFDDEIKKEDINELYIVAGPGSFTNIKVSNIILGLWKHINKNVEYYVLDSLSYKSLLRGISILKEKNSSYISIYDSNNKMINEIQNLKNDEITKIIENNPNIDITYINDINLTDDQIISVLRFFKKIDLDKYEPQYYKIAW